MIPGMGGHGEKQRKTGEREDDEIRHLHQPLHDFRRNVFFRARAAGRFVHGRGLFHGGCHPLVWRPARRVQARFSGSSLNGSLWQKP